MIIDGVVFQVHESISPEEAFLFIVLGLLLIGTVAAVVMDLTGKWFDRRYDKKMIATTRGSRKK